MRKIWHFILIIGLISLTNQAFSKGVVLKNLKPSVKFITAKDACLKLGHSNTLFATNVGMSKIDCMGTVVSANTFCQKEFATNPRLTRGVVFKEDNTVKVACHFAENSIVTVSCKRFPTLCKDASKSCKFLNSVYAINLELGHGGIVSTENENLLKCYYSEKLNFEELGDLAL